MSKKPAPFNNPFGAVKLSTPEPAKAPARAPVPPPSRQRSRSSDDDDAALFVESVGEVDTVRRGPARVPPPAQAPVARADDDLESLTRLAESVTSTGAFTVESSGELIEAWRRDFDVRVVKKLKAGAFHRDVEIDLHGLTRDEALRALASAIQRSRVAGHRCLLIVTGRGLHSESGEAVLKNAVVSALTSNSRDVLAFTSAKPEDGGAGAIYTLLRR
ncbi:MAG: Smr/MutS family protein [Archangium sp.]|nr:Smr/MutS family protein [Archangium sp.]